MKIATGAAGDDIQIIGKARDVLLEALARASGQPYVRIHVGRG
jgi:hypothetical protein